MIAVSGVDYSTWRDRASRLQTGSAPAGLTVVDTRTWVMQASRGLAYVGVPDEPMRVVDLASGRVVGERRQHPLLLLGDSSVVG